MKFNFFESRFDDDKNVGRIYLTNAPKPIVDLNHRQLWAPFKFSFNIDGFQAHNLGLQLFSPSFQKKKDFTFSL